MRLITLMIALTVTMVLGACSGTDDEGGAPVTTQPPTTESSTTTTEREDDGDGLSPLGSPSLETVEEGGFPAGSGDTALLVDVRIGGHEGFDRVVLEFENRTPASYRIGYVDPPVRQDGSGNQVEVAGTAFLEIRSQPAAGFDPLSDDAQETYAGPQRLSPEGTELVQEVVRTGDFEGQLAWVVGAGERLPFGVATLDGPPRLVVDLVDEQAGQSAATELEDECTFTDSGWEVTVAHPAAWTTNEATHTDVGAVPPCRVFDPDDAEPPRAQELTAYGFLGARNLAPRRLSRG
ncbi:MAG: AMIN-like domain-containing (lipo)protein [Acidimicrobiales bacterium]